MPFASPKTTDDVCSSSSIAHLAAKRIRRSAARTRSPDPGSVRSRKSSGVRRRTTTGAMTRAFGVSSNASHESPTASFSTSFESIAWRNASAPGPRTPTKSRGRAATRIAVTAIDGGGVECTSSDPAATAAGFRDRTRAESALADSALAESSVGTVFRGRAERKVIEAGYDPARLPPGQYLTEKWPVLHAGDIPATDLATWDFAVTGEVANPIRLSWDEFNQLARTEVTEDIHCV